MGSFPKLRVVVERLTTGFVLPPVPERVAVCGLPVALSVRVTEAAKDPLAAGMNVTLTVQLAPAATLPPQLLLCAKSPGFAPVSLMLLMLKAALPVLLSVEVWAELVVPTAWLPKARVVGDKLAVGCPTPTPVPDKEMLRVRLRALVTIDTLPVTLPAAAGAKLTSKVVPWLTPRVRGNASPLTLKPVPRTVSRATHTLRVPVLVSVTAKVLRVPTVTFPKLRLSELKLSCVDPAAHLDKQRIAVNAKTKRAGWIRRPALGVFRGFSI